jgi:hypothetical protein
MATYKVADVLAFLIKQGCKPTGDKISGGIAFETASGYGFILPIYDRVWIDADLVDDILANRWIVPCAHHIKKYEQ